MKNIRHNTTAVIGLLLAFEPLLPGNLKFKVTRATDGAVHYSVHASGETRAILRDRIPLRDLQENTFSPESIRQSVYLQLHMKNLLA